MKKIIRGVVDISLWHKRFKGEKYDLREFVQPNTLMVKELAEELGDPLECYRHVVEEVDYPFRPSWPSWTMIFSDFHILFRHPPRPKLSINFLDFWKFPSETLRDYIGDCEDCAFLCASLLRALGERAYAVIGYMMIDDTRYGHAWVEWYDGDVCKLLETTYDSVPDHIPSCEELDKIYFPEVKFNEQEVIQAGNTTVDHIKYLKSKHLRKPKRLRKEVEGCLGS